MRPTRRAAPYRTTALGRSPPAFSVLVRALMDLHADRCPLLHVGSVPPGTRRTIMTTNMERTARMTALWWLAASAVACGGADRPPIDHQSAAQQVPTCPNPGSCYVDSDYDGIGNGSLVQSCGCGTPDWSNVDD